MDFMIVYNALVLNDGKPQAFFDHPSYFTILSVKVWFQLMHALGMLDAWKLSSIPSALNLPAFDAAMTSAISRRARRRMVDGQHFRSGLRGSCQASGAGLARRTAFNICLRIFWRHCCPYENPAQ